MAAKRRYELVQRESGLWVILSRIGSKASVVETGHLDRSLAVQDLDSYDSSRTLSPISQGWLKVADRLAGNMKTGRHTQKDKAHDVISRVDVLRLLMEQDYTCPISGSYFTHDAFDGEERTSPYQPSMDRQDATQGYVLGNVRVVCLLVNMAMNTWGEGPLLEIAGRIAERSLRPDNAPIDGVGHLSDRRPIRLTHCRALEIPAVPPAADAF